MRFLLFILILLLPINVWANTPTQNYRWVTGKVFYAVTVNANEDAKLDAITSLNSSVTVDTMTISKTTSKFQTINGGLDLTTAVSVNTLTCSKTVTYNLPFCIGVQDTGVYGVGKVTRGDNASPFIDNTDAGAGVVARCPIELPPNVTLNSVYTGGINGVLTSINSCIYENDLITRTQITLPYKLVEGRFYYAVLPTLTSIDIYCWIFNYSQTTLVNHKLQ